MSDTIPAFLVDPPWEQEARAYRAAVEAERAKEVPFVPGLEPPAEQHVVWEPGEREQWLDARRPSFFSSKREKQLLEDEGWEGVVQAYEVGKLSYPPSQAAMFRGAPEGLVLPLLPGWEPRFHGSAIATLKVLAARFELGARHVVLPNAKAHAYDLGPALMPFLDVEVARMMADWYVRLKSAQRVTRGWFARHGTAAVPFLVPDALAKRRVPREKAVAALTLIASEHGTAGVVEAARRHGDRAAEAIERVLADAAPQAVEIEKPEKPLATTWLKRDGLPEVRLLDGRALPPEAVENLIGALTLSPGVRWNGPPEYYPGLDEVLGACDPASLAAFSWALFEGWLDAGLPNRTRWVVDQFIWLADDEVTRRLGAFIRKRPRDLNNHGVATLADIGTDTALIQLHRIARQATPGLRRVTEERLAWAARVRGLTTDQLADRLVPDLGLNSDGTLVLDYGPRSFTVGFDEQLRPFVIDDSGKHRKTLPKPGAKDDADLAPAAYQRFTALKKDVRDIAADQIRRLEQALADERPWSPEEFQRYFVEHPLLRHIARRLVWVTEEVAFRIAEDLTLADVRDTTVTLPENAKIWVAHPVDLTDPDELASWTALFADYEIAQPFAQLTRPIHALTDDERKTGNLERFAGVTVPVGALLGLMRRGWERGPAGDGGVQTEMIRPVEDGLALVIRLDPGIAAGAVDLFPEQRLREVGFTRPPGDTIGTVAAAEILTDLAGLT
ncbi:DUF4132 domain-containing protein [Spirillospora sp. NPDC047279]|uniref:DUF4132 domain-containing protein n=1 Tax=Spirillospora sp. NPDC047279 TaxID=3155478 RepID=UPI0033D0CFF7